MLTALNQARLCSYKTGSYYTKFFRSLFKTCYCSSERLPSIAQKRCIFLGKMHFSYLPRTPSLLVPSASSHPWANLIAESFLSSLQASCHLGFVLSPPPCHLLCSPVVISPHGHDFETCSVCRVSMSTQIPG
jgi:hypothetical protein